MKLLVVLVSFVALCTGSAIPLIPGDNSFYVEGKSRYIWMPDGHGNPHLVDLQVPIEPTDFETRGGAENQYWLYTRDNPESAQIITHGDEDSIWESNYVATKPLMVIVHGWQSNGNSDLNPLITSAYLAVSDANVIVLDWSSVASGLYTVAVWTVPDVAQYLGDFLVWLIDTAGGNWNNVHLVGHSLGAHVVGLAGRRTGSLPGRISGLDPAGPQWGNNPLALTYTDGQYVESIHTDGGILGIFDPISHVDMYPNGGRNPQPGCWISTCSHGRSTELFASSVRTNHFTARLCEDIEQAENSECTGTAFNMGNSILTKRGSGIYGLSTASSWPF